MPEGLSAQEVGKEISEHGSSARENEATERHIKRVSIIEAVLLSIVARFHTWAYGCCSSLSQITFANKAVTSAMRFEKPHSLSYHAMTRTKFPSITLV